MRMRRMKRRMMVMMMMMVMMVVMRRRRRRSCRSHPLQAFLKVQQPAKNERERSGLKDEIPQRADEAKQENFS
eukprot:694686-Hanusia_phi.AAC.1